MGKAARTTISIPAGLKAQMEAVDVPVNWSAVACAAFKQKLAEIITRKGPRDMGDVIARLRASKQRRADERYQKGFADGRQWAETKAEAEDLERIELFWQQSEPVFRGDHFSTEMAYGACECFFAAIRPEDEGNRRAAKDFWEMVAGDDCEVLRADTRYVHGFTLGALEVWDEVKDQL
jgi:hypothetical protein